MDNRNEIYRSLCREALLEAGYHGYLSPYLRDVVLETADELYLEKLEEEHNGRKPRMGRLAQKWLPSLAA